MKRVVLCYTLFFCVFLSTIGVAYAEEEGGNGKGLLSGGLHKVESTVKETTEPIVEVVDSAVEEGEQTVQDVAAETKATVETLVDPGNEQPVSKTVNQTVGLVGKTVEPIIPVVENAAKTVQGATSKIKRTTEKLPVIPVVTPVLDEVSNDVEETTEIVQDAVENVQPKFRVVEEADSVFNIEKPALLEVDVTLPGDTQQNGKTDKLAVRPNVDTYQDEPVDELPSTIGPSKAAELESNKGTLLIANEVIDETAVNPVNHSINKVEIAAEQESPMIPIPSGESVERLPIILTTGSTSINSPLVTNSGSADVMAGIVDVKVTQINFSGRQWVHSDELLRIQWIHAPPGQPPEFSPFFTS